MHPHPAHMVMQLCAPHEQCIVGAHCVKQVIQDLQQSASNVLDTSYTSLCHVDWTSMQSSLSSIPAKPLADSRGPCKDPQTASYASACLKDWSHCTADLEGPCTAAAYAKLCFCMLEGLESFC